MAWGFTVPFFPIVGFLGLIVGLGLHVRLWHVLRITVTVEFLRELMKCFMGLADRLAHASKCCFVCSVV